MAGEMSASKVTKEAYPFHFGLAKELGGEVMPFDQYQGPYVNTHGKGTMWLERHGVKAFGAAPYVNTHGKGTMWLCYDEESEGYCVYWYNEYTKLKSELFSGQRYDNVGIRRSNQAALSTFPQVGSSQTNEVS